MKFFWPIYAGAAVLGTACVYWLAPLARPRPEPAAEVPARPAAEVAAEQGPAEVAAAVAGEAEPETPAPARAPLTAADERSPAASGIHVAAQHEKPQWGVTFQRATYYGLDGARLGHVPGGVVFDVRGVRVASIGEMVECQLTGEKVPSAPCLVSRKDVRLFTGSRDKLTPRQRETFQTYYTLSGKVGARRSELLQAAAAKNPYFAEYQQAYQKYMAHVETAKALTAKRDKATELDKVRLDDQLREMKVAETSLRATYDAIHAKFRTWKEQHAGEIVKAENDPDVRKWVMEMNELRGELPTLAL